MNTPAASSWRFVGMLAVVVAAAVAAPTRAAVVLVDFGSDASFRGATVPNPDPNGHSWNSIAPGAFILNMIDLDGHETAVDLGFDTPVGTDSFNGPAGVTSFPPTPAQIAATDIDATALGNLGVMEAVFDFAASPGGADNRTRVQIQQLNRATPYALTFFGSHKFSTDDATVYTVYSDAGYTNPLGTARLNVQQPGAPHLHNRDTVAIIDGLAVPANGILYVEFVGANGNLGYLNAMQIAAVPEPGTWATLTCGAALLASLRRRRLRA